MKTYSIFIFACLLFSCSSNKSKENPGVSPKLPGQSASKEVKEVEQTKSEIRTAPKSIANGIYKNLDSLINNDIQVLDSIYPTTPFYTTINGRNYYIVCDGSWKFKTERFSGKLKYGIANDSLITVLKPDFDKIYNPNLAIQNCFEIKQGLKVGLFNYETNELLNPQFDFILPDSKIPNSKAYGYKMGEWYEINSHSLSKFKQVDFDPIPTLKTLSFNIMEVGNNMMFDSYYNYYENEGRGIVINPSYVEYLNLLSSDYYHDIILSDQKNIAVGTESARFTTSQHKTISDKLISFFISVYESGIDARGYQLESEELILYNSEKNKVKSIHLGSIGERDYFCRESGYRFVNDSIIEVKSNENHYNLDGQLYNFETKYTYHKIFPNGDILELASNRYFDFTKVIIIDENHLKGCFANYMASEAYDNYNIWLSDHLSIDDLDIMRNEIFADYGYKFKSEKWQNYFSKKSWYHPQFDNVDDKLTEIDKVNIQTILKVKESMVGNEEKITNKRPSTYYAAG